MTRESQPEDPRNRYRPEAGEIPVSPGVYRFSDRHGRVLYIGKAKNLRNRVGNYFQPLATLPPRTQRMLQLAQSIDWTVVSNDTEALILEHTWIQEFEPPFNVQFRDDKSYPYLAVTLAEESPRLIITRNRRIRGAKYFGPYPKVWALKQMTAHLQQAFPIRTCNDSDYRRALGTGRPCLSGQIGRCFGPCSGKVTVAEHQHRVMQLVSFLSGNDREMLKQLQREMAAASAELEFERAAKLRDQIIGIEHVLEQNSVVLRSSENIDVFGLESDDLSAAIHQFIVRGGRIRGERSWIVDLELDDSEPLVLQRALQAVYEEAEPPTAIIVPAEPDSNLELSRVLASKRPRGGRVRISVPERGEKRRLLEQASRNAGEQLLRHKLKRASDITSRTDALAELQTALGLDEPPLRIECIDVSHLQGSEVVAALIVFEDGLPAKSEYRKYRLQENLGDTDAIYEVVKRRSQQINEHVAVQGDEHAPSATRDIPGLLLVDGGPAQVAAAVRALEETRRSDIAVCGIAKRLEELWLRDDPFPVILPRTSEALFLVQRIRDEAHRFAITFHRQRRSTGIRSLLSEIPGLGPKRTNQLLRHFGSVARLKQATTEEVASVPGFGPSLANLVVRRLHPAEPGTLEEAQSGEDKPGGGTTKYER